MKQDTDRSFATSDKVQASLLKGSPQLRDGFLRNAAASAALEGDDCGKTDT
jgi:hypothetical protein